MAEEEAEREYNTSGETVALKQRFRLLIASLRDSSDLPLDASARFCHEFCQILVEHGSQWKSEENPLPLLEMYTVAILCFAEASTSLLPECEHVTIVLEKLALSCLDFLLSLLEKVPDALWKEFQSSVKVAYGILEARGKSQLSSLLALANESGVWTNSTLCSLLSNYTTDVKKVHELLVQEGPILLEMRIKHLIKRRCVEKAAVLAKACAEFPEFGGKKNFKQIYLVCLCEIMSQQELMQEIKDIDCKDALDMICNLESEENEKGALNLCTAFLKRQLLQADIYCAWELTLFWSKLLIRLESTQAFLEQCRMLAQLSDSVYHILLLIKVIQEEVHDEGLPVCIEMCIQALKMGMNNSEDCNSTICKTISCLLPLDLEVKRACQLTEFLVKPSLDSYYAVEMLFNEPDQKLEEENLPLPNSLRCDVLLALKTKWPFDPEFWDWKTLKRHCLALMGEDASIVSSMDTLNDHEENEVLQACDDKDFSGHIDFLLGSTSQPSPNLEVEKKKKREMKRLREQGFVSARFRNWQAYMQYCVLCDKEFLGHRIVKHALKHVQDGIFRCPICVKTFETRAVLEPHVASHVKESCKERLAALNIKNTNSDPANTLWSGSKSVYIESSVKSEQIACTDFEPLNTNSNTTGKVKSKLCLAKRGNPVREIDNTEDCSCPVTSCQKVFKYFRNLVAHVKAHKDDEEARHFLELQSQKAVCHYCRRQFVNVTHLNDHLQIHSGDRPYVCIQLRCNSSFNSHAELNMHRKVHSEFQAQCTFQNCGRVFNEAYLLYDHEAQHYITFICKSDNCDKVFYSQSQLNAHQKEHSNLENNEEIKHQIEALPQTLLNQELTSNQEGAVSYVSTVLQTKHTQNCNLITSELDFSSVTDFTKAASQLQSCVDHSSQSCLKSCYVKLQPIPIKHVNSDFLNGIEVSDMMDQIILQDQKLFCHTCEQHTIVQRGSGISAALTLEAQSAKLTLCTQNAVITHDAMNQEVISGAQSLAVAHCAQTGLVTPVKGPAVTFQTQGMTVCLEPHNAEVALEVQEAAVTPRPQGETVTNEAQIVSLTPGAQTASLAPGAQTASLAPGAQSVSLTAGAQSVSLTLGAQTISFAPGAQTASLTPGAQTASLTPGAQTASSTPGAQTASLTPGAPPVSSTPEAPIASSTPEAPIASSTPGAPNTSPTPGAPTVSSTSAVTLEAQSVPVTPRVQNMTIKKKSANPMPLNNRENEHLIHVCPFESCTRKYSTVKSLSRHIKNVHVEAFEEWKLSRKYKRIADFAAKKSSEPKNCNLQTHKKKIKSAASQKKFAEVNLNKFSTDSPITGPPFNAKFKTQNEIQITDNTLMQPKVTESWNSSSFEECNSNFSLPNQFPPMVMPGGFQHNYTSFTDLLADRDIDYVPSLSAAGTEPTGSTDPHSDVLNEASKYVSNSLRVLHALNSDQTCEVSQVELSEEELGYMATRQTNKSVPPNVNNLCSVQNSGQSFDPYFSSRDMCDNSGQPLEKQEKQCTIDQASLYFSPDVKNHQPLPDCKEEPKCPSVSSVKATEINSDQNEDFASREMVQVTAEDDDSFEVIEDASSTDINKLKKIKTSKRTKWPAILKDGKVICCRCYREFSSTKSLGGHLSKRSQCRPVDEIDLTADLPSSFLDFLNDPEISTMHSPLHVDNGQDSQSFINDSESILDNNCFVDGKGMNYNTQNGHVASGEIAERSFTETLDLSENSSSMPFLNMTVADLPTVTDNDVYRNFETQVHSTVLAEDGKILEIERALQRLDLLDGLKQDPKKVEKPTLHNFNSYSKTTNRKNSTSTHRIESGDELLKPFKCIKTDCSYGAMTKEALFKHLARVHEESEELINELKKNPSGLSPYACSMCSKTFTRTTGLKIHYKNVHRLSKEEVSKIKIGRQEKKSSQSKDFSCRTTGPVGLTCNSTVQTQCLISPTFTVAVTDKDDKPAEVNKDSCFKQESLLLNQSPACDLQNNQSLSLQLQKDVETLLNPSCATDNLNIQCLTQDTKQAPEDGLLFSPHKHCDLEPTPNVTDHVVEHTVYQNNMTKCKEKIEPLKKEKTIHSKLGRKSNFVEMINDPSLYRPYKCVHEGCVAAFSVQHNLLLHYKAMHHSDDLKETPRAIIGSPDQAEGPIQTQEFKCQMKECSKVVTKVTSLVKHYLLLHRCTLEKTSSLLSGVDVGTFHCDQSKCPAQFTGHLKYIEHIKNDHKTIRLSADGDFERVDLTFACEYEGCDRVYTTKSNLLRHVMKKHQIPKTKQNASVKSVCEKPNDGKENILINKIKQRKKLLKKKEKKAIHHWTSFAKPTLKTRDEASSICTGKFSLEYPCMIKGCDSVSNTERNIVKHYTTHGLTERYINNRRSHFIFSKRNSRLRNKDDNEPDGAVTSMAGSAESSLENRGTIADKRIINTEECIVTAEKSDTTAEKDITTADDITTVKKVVVTENNEVTTEEEGIATVPVSKTENDVTNAEITAAVVDTFQGLLPENTTKQLNKNSVPMSISVKRKRGRPPKLATTIMKLIPQRKSLRKVRPVYCNKISKVLGSNSKSATQNEQVEKGVAQKLFSPLGLKASILKLYEEAPSRNAVRNKLGRKVLTRLPVKPKLNHQPIANKIYTKSLFELIGKRKYVVHFRNPLKLESVKNVKIVMDGSLSTGADLLLKQLQDMRPMVILQKWLCS